MFLNKTLRRSEATHGAKR